MHIVLSILKGPFFGTPIWSRFKGSTFWALLFGAGDVVCPLCLTVHYTYLMQPLQESQRLLFIIDLLDTKHIVLEVNVLIAHMYFNDVTPPLQIS